MDTSNMNNKELDFMIKKRLGDLIVIGMNIETNTRSKDEKTGKLKVSPRLTKAVNEKVTDIIEMAKALGSRGKLVRISIINQHPYVNEKLQQAIEKSGLLQAPKIKGKVIKKKKKKTLTKPRRRL